MVDRKQKRSDSKQSTKFKKSVLAMCVMAMSAPGMAQSQDEERIIIEEVLVTGMRSALQSAQDVKRDADTFVDSITADDIGALPDRSVLEAMQRIPGVSIERFAGPDDPDHFSAEGSGAVIRGMSATRSEFNGRDSFTANSGRGLSFQDVPPELMGGVDIFKNQSADMIEGGIGGTVSLRTRKPFDARDRVISVSGDLSFGDMAQEVTPTISALFSDRWETSLGEFGLLFNVAHSQLKSESHGIQSDAYVQYEANVLDGAERFGDGQVWIPNGSNALMKADDRERNGYAAAFQWADLDDTLLLTVQAMRSDATLAWTENSIKYQGGYFDADAGVEQRHTRPLPGTEFTFDDDGIFQAGTLTDSEGWRVSNENYCANRVPRGWNSDDCPEELSPRAPGDENVRGFFGHKFQAETRHKRTRTVVDDFAINLAWTPNDQWEVVGDFQYVQAETSDDDLVIHLGVHAIQDYDTRGSTPSLTMIEPWDGYRDASREEGNPGNFGEGSGVGGTGYPGFTNDPAGDSNYFQDPHSYWWRSAMDHFERSEGESVAARLDTTYHIDNHGLLRAVKAGVRFAEREQTVRNTDWNWGSLGPEFSGMALWLDGDATQDQSYVEVDWSDFHRGGVIDIPGNTMLHPSEQLVKDVIDGRSLVQTAGGDWIPYQERDNLAPGERYFAQPEIYVTTETNQAAYVRLDFGSDNTALRFSGNVGLRYINFERNAQGSIQYPDLIPRNPIPEETGLPATLTREAVDGYVAEQVDAGVYASRDEFFDDDANAWAGEARNFLSAEERAFGNHAFTLEESTASYSRVLPSLNVKVELTDDLIGRFAASQAIALPDMEHVRNQANLGPISVVQVYPGGVPDPEDEDAQARNIQGAFVSGWRGDGGNPGLEPMESNQFDASLEWYFAPVGSITGTVFFKDLKNFFIHGAQPQTFTNPETGVTQEVEVTGTRNGGSGSMKGFEFAYQQFYDMLPAPWDGLGMQFNYSLIQASGVPNNEEDFDDADWVGDSTDTGARVTMDRVPLQGQSKHTLNLVGMYEKNDWSFRLAYNWRSKYLLTTRDVISKYPLWSADAGYLDGSVFYDITDNINVGLQFTNLLNTTTKTIMILDGEGAEAGRTWFINDRRAALVFRATF